MATRTEQTVVYAAGVVQGIALVTFPAASTISGLTVAGRRPSPATLHPQPG
jgi:hypothetical protein